MRHGWRTLPDGYVVARRIPDPPGAVSIDGYHTHRAKLEALKTRVKAELRHGDFRKAVRLVEEIRQTVKARRKARRALRAAQLALLD